LKVIASADADQLAATACEDVPESESAQNYFRSALEEMRGDRLFGEVEIAALRLAATRKDPMLTQAMHEFRHGDMNSTFFKQALLAVVRQVIQETEKDL